MSQWTTLLDEAIDQYHERQVVARRHLHAHPEPSGLELKTTEFLAAEVERIGLTPRVGARRRGVLVDLANRGDSRVAVRGDIDALRIRELNDCDYVSQNPGVMHACGHDGHAACLLGVLQGLKVLNDSGVLPGPIPLRGVFQPAEETSQGAWEMIEDGALEGIEAIMALHLDPGRVLGTIGVRAGALTASCDDIDITILGRGGHAARPHESVDPIAAAAQLINSIYALVPRNVDSHESVVVTFGQVLAGDSANVIPEKAILRGTIRTLAPTLRERAKALVRQIAGGIAEATGTDIEVTYHGGTQSVQNDAELTELFRRVGSQLLGEECVHEIHRPSMGGEDFAHYLEQIPGAMFRLGCSHTQAASPPLHSPHFNFDERALALGAKLLARAVVYRAGLATDG